MYRSCYRRMFVLRDGNLQLSPQCGSYCVIRYIKSHLKKFTSSAYSVFHSTEATIEGSTEDEPKKRGEKRKQEKALEKKRRRRQKQELRDQEPLVFESDYYFENGFRKVYPFHYTYRFYTRGHWFDRPLMDVYTTDLHLPRHTVESAIESGKLTVSGKPISVDHILKRTDVIETSYHRHENPVIASPIQILVDNEDFLVVDKPASIPCHPCGAFYHNSLSMILGKEMGYGRLKILNRLDRPTSGLVVLLKNLDTASELHKQLRQRQIQKEYVCRVEGEFPVDETVCEEPIGTYEWKSFIQRVIPEGQPCRTVFKRLSYNGRSSVVKCIPYTGRTHQIRVHLQYLGHPIINDNLYNTTAFGPNKGKGGCTDISDREIYSHLKNFNQIGYKYYGENELFYQRIQELKGLTQNGISIDNFQTKHIMTDSDSRLAMKSMSCSNTSESLPSESVKNSECISEHRKDVSQASNQPGFEWNKWIPDEDCPKCRMKSKDPDPRDLILYLHAMKYTGDGWEFKTELPDWAREDWQEPKEDLKHCQSPHQI